MIRVIVHSGVAGGDRRRLGVRATARCGPATFRIHSEINSQWDCRKEAQKTQTRKKFEIAHSNEKILTEFFFAFCAFLRPSCDFSVVEFPDKL